MKEIVKDFVFNDQTFVNYYGRNLFYSDSVTLINTASAFEVSFFGTFLTADLKGSSAYVRVYLDGNTTGERILAEPYKETVLLSGIESGFHTAKIVKATSEAYGLLKVNGIFAEGFCLPEEKPKLKLQFYGDSLTAGYGVFATDISVPDSIDVEDGTFSFAYLLSQKLNAETSELCKSGIAVGNDFGSGLLPMHFKNYGIFDHTVYPKNLYTPDIVVVTLGTNDYNYMEVKGIKEGSLEEKACEEILKNAYVKFVKELEEYYPKSTKMVCNFSLGKTGVKTGKVCISAIKSLGLNNVYLRLGKEVSFSDISFHPDEKGHKSEAENLYLFLKENGVI